MKKTISLFLVLVLCLSLCACGSAESQLSKDDLISNAITTNVSILQAAVYQNKAKAKQDYCNKPIIVSGKAILVEDDHVVICDSQVCLDAYLSIDDLVKIDTDSNITVVGIISDIQDLDISWGGTTFTFPHYIMESAFLVEE